MAAVDVAEHEPWLGQNRVFGSVDPNNVSSVKLLQRVGMRQEAHFVKSLWFKGEWVDDVIFAILASEWKSYGNSSVRCVGED